MNASRPASSWQTIRLGDIAEIIRGLAFPSADKSFERAEGLIACLRTTNVQREVEWSDLWFIPRKHVRNQRQVIRTGDILISTANSYELVGKVAQVKNPPTEATLGAFISMIRANVELNPKYIHYQLASSDVQQRIREMASTTTNISNVSTSKLAELDLNIAPRPEQDRVVAEIEKQFTRLDDAVTALKRVQANLKRYRASVLKAACEGRLVSTEAELARKESRNYEPASELLKRILAERRAKWEAAQLNKLIAAGKPPKDDAWENKYEEPTNIEAKNIPALPQGWLWISLDAVLLGIEAGRSFKCQERPPAKDETGVVKVSAVTWGEFNEEESKTCLDSSRHATAFLINKGDFLFSRANTIELVGACVIVKSIHKRLMLSDKILRFRFASAISPEWILYVLRSEWGRYEIERLSTGNQESMRNIGQDRIRSMRIPIPPATEMKEIVRELELKNTAIDESLKAVMHNLLRSRQLQKAVLAKAFSGKLVAQDASDEPAGELLDRIRAAKKGAQGVFDFDAMPKKRAVSTTEPHLCAKSAPRSKKAGAR